MPGPRTLALCIGMMLVPACERGESPAPAAEGEPRPACQRSAAAAGGPLLELNLDVEPWLELGKPLALQLSLRNRSCDPVTLVRPTRSAWDDHGYPRYRLEIHDELGNAVARPPPTGGPPEADALSARDFVTAAPGKTVPLFGQPGSGDAIDWRVAPGMYELRVRYAAPRIVSAAETLRTLSGWNAVPADDPRRMLFVVSNVVPVRVDRAPPAP